MSVRLSYTYVLNMTPEELAAIQPELEAAGYTIETIAEGE